MRSAAATRRPVKSTAPVAEARIPCAVQPDRSARSSRSRETSTRRVGASGAGAAAAASRAVTRARDTRPAPEQSTLRPFITPAPSVSGASPPGGSVFQTPNRCPARRSCAARWAWTGLPRLSTSRTALTWPSYSRPSDRLARPMRRNAMASGPAPSGAVPQPSPPSLCGRGARSSPSASRAATSPSGKAPSSSSAAARSAMAGRRARNLSSGPPSSPPSRGAA